MYKNHSKDDEQSFLIKSKEMSIFASITQNMIWEKLCPHIVPQPVIRPIK